LSSSKIVCYCSKIQSKILVQFDCNNNLSATGDGKNSLAYFVMETKSRRVIAIIKFNEQNKDIFLKESFRNFTFVMCNLINFSEKFVFDFCMLEQRLLGN